MNSVFYCKSNCLIDICQIYKDHNSFLNQASTLTKGSYTRVKSSKYLYGALSYFFLPDVDIRRNMEFKKEILDSMEVRCSCHGTVIKNNMAYVCSVCLGILCEKCDHCPLHEDSQ